MTDKFKCIYKILKALETAMDYPEFDISQISHEKLGISQERWSRYIEMMLDVGYIKGVNVYTDCTGECCVDNNGIRITLKGLEYLTENTAIVTPAAIGDFFNVSVTTFIDVPCSCCVTVSVENTSDTSAIDVTNANIIFDRVA